MRIAILGAGGLGSHIGATLHEAKQDVVLVARGEHLRALETRGLEVVEGEKTRTLAIPCSAAVDLVGDFDVAFVTVKAYALENIAPTAARLARRGAWIVPFVNGVDAHKRLVAAGVPAERAAAGVAYVTAFKTRPGTVVRQGTHQRLLFGPIPSLPSGQHPLAAAFAGTPVDVEIVDDIRVELWRKMAVVCALAALCGEVQGPIGVMRGDIRGSALQRAAVAEVFAVARASGVPLTDALEVDVHRTLDAFDDSFFPSLLHDLRQGQRTEVDALNGTVSRAGREVGVFTPCHDRAAAIIRAADTGTPS